MSQFSEEPPETLEDWNTILGQCCCAMPECPVPTRECKSDVAGYYANSLDYFGGEHYLTLTQIYDYYPAGGGPLVEDETVTTTIRIWGLAAGPCGETNPPPDSHIGTPLEGNLGITGIEFVSRADVFNLGTWQSAVLADYATHPWDADCALGSQCYSSMSGDWETGYGSNTLFRRSAFKWVIPSDWGLISPPGTYFKITWDVAFFPTTGDPTAVSTDNTWEWTGPGDPEDEDSWKSDWYEIPVPDEPGENRVVNIRFECYRSTAFGNKPQVTGEAVEIPPP
jgi:hypothetical protein